MDNRAEKITVDPTGTARTTEQASRPAAASAKFDFPFILNRAQRIMTAPGQEWQSIREADESINTIYSRFFVYIAAVAAICQFLETVGDGVFGALFSAVLIWALSLGALYLVAMIVELIAPKFDAPNCTRTDAVRLLAYSSTPGMLVAPIVGLIPGGLFAFISGLIGLYGLYIFYTGITPIAGVPEQKRITFLLACAAALIAVGFVISALLGPLLFASRM